MAVSPETVSSIRPAATSPRARTLARVARSELALGTMIVASIVGRVVAAVPHSAPRLFPDEYIYSALARSISHGRLTIRGASAQFPALLESIVTAPLWLLSDVEASFRAVQVLHAVIVSLVAVPVWLLARRLALPPWQCLAAAALSLALPDLLSASYLTADAVGLTLAVAAVYAAVVALETARTKPQLAFLGLASLATLQRTQYVALFGAFAIAAVAVTRARPLAAVRRYRVTTLAGGLAGAAAALVVAATGPGRMLGYYRHAVDTNVDLGAVGHWVGVDAMLLCYACGFVTVPAALAGLVGGSLRPRSVTERAFTVFGGVFAALVLLETGIFTSKGADRFQERYLMALLPLVGLLFFLGSRRLESRRTRYGVLAVALAMLLLAARVPLSGYLAALGTQDSPLLQAVSQLTARTSVSSGSLVVALVAGGLALAAGLAAIRHEIGVPVAAALALLVLASASAASTITDVQRSHGARGLFPADARWIDHSGLRNVDVLEAPGAFRPAISSALFWNTRLTRILKLPRTDDVDIFGAAATRIGPRGLLQVAGRPLSDGLLVDEYASDVELTGATLVRRDTGSSLWKLNGQARVAMLSFGRYLDGWLGLPYARVTVWPTADGVRRGAICVDLTLPPGVSSTARFRGAGVRRDVLVEGGSDTLVAIPVAAARPWHVDISTDHPLVAGKRPVSVQASRPRFVAGTFNNTQAATAACR
jgi:hypothetical protein